jgi:hypothetical protein
MKLTQTVSSEINFSPVMNMSRVAMQQGEVTCLVQLSSVDAAFQPSRLQLLSLARPAVEISRCA